MSLFYAHYGCHPEALVMRKSDGAIFRVHGNVSLWNMDAVLELWDAENNRRMYNLEEISNDDGVRKKAIVVVKSKEFENSFLILDDGVDILSEALKLGLSKIASGK